MSRRETNTCLRDPITVRSTSSGLSTYYYYSFGFFWIIFYPFPIIKLSPFYLIISPVPTCLVHNCETFRRLFYSHLLSPLSQDQIPFDPHQRYQAWVLALRPDLTIKWCLVEYLSFFGINLVLRSIVSGTCRGVTVTFRRPSRVGILPVEVIV